jgi:hypothetical protein
MSNTITPTVFYRTINVEELEIFYREAGPRDAPTVLLLHGFPVTLVDGSGDGARKRLTAIGCTPTPVTMLVPTTPKNSHPRPTVCRRIPPTASEVTRC